MGSHVPPLETRQSSASLRGEATGARQVPVVSKLIDTSTCIGCKACEVACQEWNDLVTLKTEQTGTYQTLPSLDANYWNLIKFKEQELEGGGLAWLMRKDQCMHCADPGCLRACPAPGAIVQYENGIVDVNTDRCIGCGLCAAGCPFDVPRFNTKTGKMAKCTLCVDRVSEGLEPACIKACPTGCLQFGTKTDMVAMGNQRVKQLKENGFPNASLYDPGGVDGTGVVTVLAHGDHPEWYDLPRDPHVPLSVRFTKSILRPVGLVALAGAVVGSFGHFLGYGPQHPEETLPPPSVSPRKVARAPEDTVVGDRIVRHALASRVIHWSVALFFFISLLSGLPIWTPIFRWMAPLFGGLSVCRWLHPWSGVAFMAATLAMVVYWVHDMRMEHGDWGWLGPKMVRYMLGRGDEGEREDTGKYNGGQKIFFFTAGLLGVVLLATGILLWFPLHFPVQLRQVAWVVHDLSFILFAVAVVGHIYLGTAATPGTFTSMTRGTVTKTFARQHHSRWYREVTGETDTTDTSPYGTKPPAP
jgi:formate dehydrogenase iron-sulfur subunit